MIYNLGISLLWIVFSYEFNLDKYYDCALLTKQVSKTNHGDDIVVPSLAIFLYLIGIDITAPSIDHYEN